MLSWRFGRPLAICSELSLYKECVCVCVCVCEGGVGGMRGFRRPPVFKSGFTLRDTMETVPPCIQHPNAQIAVLACPQ